MANYNYVSPFEATLNNLERISTVITGILNNIKEIKELKDLKENIEDNEYPEDIELSKLLKKLTDFCVKEEDKKKRNKTINNTVEDAQTSKSTNRTLATYLIKATDKCNLAPWPVAQHIVALGNRYPAAILSIALKEISLDMDKKYPGHIAEIPVVYAFSTVTGKIITINTKDIKCFKNIAAFRTEDDIIEALHICKSLVDRCFPNDAK